MPLVRIDVPGETAPERVEALASAVHAALVDAVGIPADDRFQVVTPHGPRGLKIDPSFPGVARGPDACIVQITFRQGRSADIKRELYLQIGLRAQATAGWRPEDIMIVLHENSAIDWSFGGGIAQYEPGDAV